MNNFEQQLNDFCGELTKLKTEIVTETSSENRFNLLIGLCAVNLAIGIAVKGGKSRPIQTALLSFGGLGYLIVPEMYFGLIRQKKQKQQEINYYFINRQEQLENQ